MQQQSYICVTVMAHFLDTDWKLHKQIYWVLLGEWALGVRHWEGHRDVFGGLGFRESVHNNC